MHLVEIFALVLFLISHSHSEEYKRGSYVVVDKHIDIREIIRLGGPPKQVSNREIRGLTEKLQNLLKFQKLLPLSGLKKIGDSGHAIICGLKNVSINITWTPKTIDPQGSIQVYLDLVAPMEFKTGLLHVDVYMEMSPDPIFSVDQDATCEMIKEKLPFIQCPVPKGFHLKTSFKYDKLTQLPTGLYTIVLKVNATEAGISKEFACVNVTINIQPKPPLISRLHKLEEP